MKIAIYCRVSSDEQNNLNQELRLKEFAIKNGWDYVIFNEVESTRKTRPIKAKLLDQLRKREYDGVLVFKLDRWARSFQELINELSELVTKEISFISYTENLDFSTSSGRLQFHILAAFAAFERDLIRERTLEGLNRARAQGKKLGRPTKKEQQIKKEIEGRGNL